MPTAVITAVQSSVVEQGPFPNRAGRVLQPSKLEFLVTLSEPAPAGCRFEYDFSPLHPIDTPLTPGKDIVWEQTAAHPRPGLVEIPAGVLSATFSWIIQPDGYQEPGLERMQLYFHSARNLTIATSSVAARIEDDDGPMFIQAEAVGRHHLTTSSIVDAGVLVRLRSLNGLNSAHVTNNGVAFHVIVPGTVPDSTLHLGTYREGTVLGGQFTSSGPGHNSISAALGDVTGDGVPEVVLGSAAGLRSLVVVADTVTQQIITQFQPYGNFTPGVHVAVGDVNGDGRGDIITGPGAGGGPHLRVWDMGPVLAGTGGAGLIRDFFSFNAEFTGGLRVASGDIDADGYSDIIFGYGPGGLPTVGAYSGRLSGLNFASGPLLTVALAYGDDFPGGVWVASGDYNRDGYADIVTGAGAGGGPHVRVYSPRGDTWIESFFAPGPSDRFPGVRVANIPHEKTGTGFTTFPTFIPVELPTWGRVVLHHSNGVEMQDGVSHPLTTNTVDLDYPPYVPASTGAAVEPVWTALPPAPLPRVSIARTGPGVELRLTTEPGAWYDLEISSDLRSWQRTTSYQGDGADKVFDITPVNGQPAKRFYRAVNGGHRY